MFLPSVYTALSFFPFALFLFLLLVRKTTLLRVSLITLVASLFLVTVFWSVTPMAVAASGAKAFFIAFDIFIIIFGALFFLGIIKSTGILDHIVFYLESVSKDIRLQVILLAWLFVSFMEGMAGFGTPAALVAPVLVTLGVPPLNSVLITLLGNSSAGIFGAVGTPIRVGFSGLDYPSLPVFAASYNLAGILMPVFMLWILSRQTTRSVRPGFFWDALPFALWSGFAFIAPSLLIVHFGQEFPSVLGSLIGLLLALASIRLKIFIPASVVTLNSAKQHRIRWSPLSAFLPYLLVIVLLLIGKFLLGNTSLSLPLISHKINLFNPGAAFILASLPLLVSRSRPPVSRLAKSTLSRSLEPFLIILFMSSIVQLMVVSGQNSHNLPSVIDHIAQVFQSSMLIVWTPFIGAFGSFLTGSVTLSNLLFGNLLSDAALGAGLNVSKILALQVVGAAAGNMMALADVLAAETVVGLKHQERQVIKGVAVPCMVYLCLAVIIALVA